MPELPEVETVRRSLEPRLYESPIADAFASTLALRQKPIDRRALERLVGAHFTKARRHGKYLMLDLDPERSGQSLLVHLGMSGRLLLAPKDLPLPPHTHMRLGFRSGLELRYVDPRRFGAVRIYASHELATTDELSVLGPDPLSDTFVLDDFVFALQRTKRDLKAALLSQGIVAGLGNIYVAEALFEARLSPRRRGHRLTRDEATRLHAAVRNVLERGVANRGTTFSDYVDANGAQGGNQHSLLVYGRAGEPCRVCGTPIRRFVQGGRSTFFCPKCQRLQAK